MKSLFLILAIALGTAFSYAQPSVPARLGNRTACTIYVKVMATNPACGMILTTYTIPPYSVITTLPPLPGWWYDAALVADDATFSGTCYYQKVSVAWASCTPYAVSVVGPSCCGPNLKSTWDPAITGGGPANPFLIVYQ